MNGLSCTVSINKKSITLSPVQLSVFRQCKVIEAEDKTGNTFYLFFIKDCFFHAARLDHVPNPSMLHRVLSEGICFSGTHPLTEALLPENSAIQSLPVQLVSKKLFSKYGPLDSALYLTFFEGCLPAEKLRMELKKTFYHFRRNGQLLAAYKLLHYYLDFAPDDSFAADMLSNLSFHPYAKRYRDSSMLSIDDEAFLEFLCFDYIQETRFFDTLLSIYQKQNRWIDELAVRCHYLSMNQSKSNLQTIQSLIQQKFDAEHQTVFFQSLLATLPQAVELRDSIFHRLITQEDHLEVIRFLLQEKVTVKKEQLPFITKSFLKADLSKLSSPEEKVNLLLLELYREHPQVQEEIINRFVLEMMQTHDLKSIKDWLAVFIQDDRKLTVFDMVERMERYQEDPDQQFALGKLHLYFQQYEKAIDCFIWEMELKPDDAEPIQYLIKAYSGLGEQEEIKTYTQLLHQVNKNSGMIDQP